jgi:PhnB protein
MTKLAPMLSVRRGNQALAFYRAAFGAEEQFLITDDDGAVVARLAIGEMEFWIADESPEHQNFSPETLNGGTVRMILTTDDPLDMFERAVAAGAVSISPVKEEHGWLSGRIVDPFGHHWEIGRPLAEEG